mmetsp:Transcript_5327/g.6516  ORF Transcript_5327/g.6516 Transcript_5327/m.6516 type:complete len:203 (+) Transcript_5327:208-816(+)|eukprot:CAMPEP_0194371102 /NCGR_PEP_ID=MMETSP0174-20130528/19471_1 /TAXON_ID=216777 /ORGANISM="Proboscia alata, Strain PI-D3" /LENGTH=202 /DNA_ID=CAMNT_0039148949 /DNA_START=614 /DNA_END=1222 /DNA_ORIENTATION=+
MHRDVKPRNVLITRGCRKSKKNDRYVMKLQEDDDRSLMLIDLGLAEFYLPEKRYNVRVASRHYKSPELLIGNEFYDYSIDLWGVGCILAGLLFRREPFFRGRDNVDQLAKIASVLGTNNLLKYCASSNIKLSSALRTAVGFHQKKPWASVVTKDCPQPSRQGLDFLDKLLEYDHTQRLTAREAMSHAFFDDVRDECKIPVKN